MKKLNLGLITALLLVTSCQSASPPPPVDKSVSVAEAVARHAQIKSDKKKQSDLDLPFRGFPIEQEITTVAFGSCADQDQPQPIWTTVEKNQPQLMLMLGDNVYALKAEQKPLSEQYKKLRKITEYRSVREKVPFMATLDDGDFGVGVSATQAEKDESKLLFIKNWPYLRDLIDDRQDGVYHAKIFGKKKNTLQVIMLDTRYGRSEFKKNDSADPAERETKPYLADDDKSKRILSDKQWAWLEKQLKKPAGFRIIASSIQLIANDHQFEKWGNFPHERQRFFDLLKKLKIKNAIVISGGRQIASIAKKEIHGIGNLYDVTSSGLNKSSAPGNVLKDASYMTDGFGAVNFGLVKIDWSEHSAHVEIKSLENEKAQGLDIRF
ncbi:MAG: alkaline phosphatase D family protein [Pseudobdellovibrio sp.]